MDKRTTSIVITLVTVFLCGCPGLFGLCFGAIFVFAGIVPGSNININGSSNPADAIKMGLVALCLGIIFVAIPAVVAFTTLRKKKLATAGNINEPLPPAS
jgi:biopolymer transport protein ExbB/TolQ